MINNLINGSFELKMDEEGKIYFEIKDNLNKNKKINNENNDLTSFSIRYINFKEMECSLSYTYYLSKKIDNYIIPFFNNDLNELFNLKNIESFRNKLKNKNVTVHYKNSILTILKDMINYARKVRLIDSELRDDLIEFIKPFKIVEVIKLNSKNKYTPLSDLYHLLSVVNDFNDNCLLRLLYFSGLRIGEFLGIQRKDIHFKRGVAYININKQKLSINNEISYRLKSTSSYKTIVYTNDNAKYLKEYILKNKIKKNDFLFPLYHKKVQRKLNFYLKLANLDHNSLHGFGRKSINTELYKYGADTKVRTTLLGQASFSVNENNYIDDNLALKKGIRYLKNISR